MEVDQKNKSLDELIQMDKQKKRFSGGQRTRGGFRTRGGRGGSFRGGRPRQGSGEFKPKKFGAKGKPQAGNDLMKPKRTQNMIQKKGGKPQPNPEKARPATGKGAKPQQAKLQQKGIEKKNGGKTLNPAKKLREKLAAPKKVLKVPPPTSQKKDLVIRSKTRLKVRNIDDKQVTNEDLIKLFARQGELNMCRFDRDYFGNFLGQATVEYKRAADAERAVKEYHGAFLDDRVLTVEFDVGASSPESFPGPAKDLSAQKGGQQKGNGSKPSEGAVKKINLSSQTNGKKKNIRI